MLNPMRDPLTWILVLWFWGTVGACTGILVYDCSGLGDQHPQAELNQPR